MAKIIKLQLCKTCIRYRDDPVFSNPNHLVHPKDSTPMLFDIYGIAVCPVCRARWRSDRNVVSLVE